MLISGGIENNDCACTAHTLLSRCVAAPGAPMLPTQPPHSLSHAAPTQSPRHPHAATAAIIIH